MAHKAGRESAVWQRSDGDHDGDVKAVFTETAKGQWDVAFHFEWEDGQHVYAGTATGSLTGGELRGRVENDNEERKAAFRFPTFISPPPFGRSDFVVGIGETRIRVVTRRPRAGTTKGNRT